MDDQRLTALKAELEELTQQARTEIPLFVQQWEIKLAEQRGRIAEREEMLNEIAGVPKERIEKYIQPCADNAPHYHENSPVTRFGRNLGPIIEEREKEA